MSKVQDSSTPTLDRDAIDHAKTVAAAASHTAHEADHDVLKILIDEFRRAVTRKHADDGSPDVLFQVLMGEINDLLKQQGAAAESQNGCRSRLIAALSGPDARLEQAASSGKPLTHAELEGIAQEVGNAVAAYQRCMMLLRPKIPIG